MKIELYKTCVFLITLCLLACASRTNALNDNAIPLKSDREDQVAISSKADIGHLNLSIDEHKDIREIEKMNARKKAKDRSLNANYTNKTIEAEGEPKFMVVPGLVRPPKNWHQPNNLSNSHEKMTNKESSSNLVDIQWAQWANKNLK